MSRIEFELYESGRRNHTVAEMRQLGYYSARCVSKLDECPGWQAVAVPPESLEFERRNLLAALRRLDPKPFGG